MPKSILNTVVFVGREIVASLLDEKVLCGELGPIDESSQIKAGPVGQFIYSRGQSNLLITPDRIDLRFPARKIFPEQFVRAARVLAHEVEQIRRGTPITAVGLNCDAVFYSQEIGKDGVQFCRDLADTDFSRQLLREQSSYSLVVQFTYRSNAMQYNVRFEPDNGSRGRDLLLAVNGHQEVTARDNLLDKLSETGEFQEQVNRFHARIFPEGK